MNIQTISKKGTVTAMVGLAMLVGAVGGNVFKVSSASAQTTTGTTTAATATTTQDSTQTAQAPRDPSKGGHTANGKTETLLTGDTATKVTAAALASNPGATIQRVETDADGGVYEAHLTKSDGSQATVIFDANFNVTATQTGHGGGN